MFIQLPTDAAGSGADASATEECKVIGRLSGAGLGEGYVRCVRWKPVYDADDDDDDDEDDGDDQRGGGGGDAASAAESLPVSRLLATVAPDCVAVWDVTVSGTAPVSVSSALVASWAPPASAPAVAASFDPTAPCRLVIAAGSALYAWDARESAAPRLAVRAPHGADRVLDVSCNGNRPWHCATAGEDGCTRLWDIHPPAVETAAAAAAAAASGGGEDCAAVGALDGPTSALLCLQGHAHWCTAVRFNPYHDQLLLSAGTDGGVCLWSAVSASSAPLNDADDDIDDDDGDNDGGGKPAAKPAAGVGHGVADSGDAVVRRWGSHADSVSASSVDWGHGSAWVLASASAEGRVAFREVPKDTKYKILLR